ncbi:UNVERIFIED_CONTAM: hypothetical protein PYX00_011144 [Menopon gallinae]|uniref:tryptophan--tRNA ligase n=1 Tax=Menopon gallinae TaxID=328185 RepID=A0AAW2H652_9NEOP
MIQFKEKSGNNKEKASCGLYFYPVLMAADILLYNSNIVPVGEDQKQHLEFTRDVATAFNSYYNTSFFNIPEPYILPGSRVMSLKDGTKKMSKSDPSDFSKILFSDSDENIVKKIKKAKTDSQPIDNNIDDLKKRPEAYNLLNIYSLVTKTSLDESLSKFKGLGFALVKQELIDILIKLIKPLRLRYNELLQDKSYLIKVLKDNTEKVRNIAHNNLVEIKKIIGFIE